MLNVLLEHSFNNLRVGKIFNNIKTLLNSTCIHESHKNYPKNALHMHADNESAMKMIETTLNDLHSELFVIASNEKISNNLIYPLATI